MYTTEFTNISQSLANNLQGFRLGLQKLFEKKAIISCFEFYKMDSTDALRKAINTISDVLVGSDAKFQDELNHFVNEKNLNSFLSIFKEKKSSRDSELTPESLFWERVAIAYMTCYKSQVLYRAERNLM